MPEVVRSHMRMNCNGIDLVNPIDRQPEGSFPYLFNARVVQEGILESRPGYDSHLALSDPPNSVRRLNDSTGLAPGGYAYVGGGGTKLYFGPPGSYNPIVTGFSGDPLSLIPFRPDQSPQSWMYVYDRQRMVKVRPDGIVQAIGIPGPSTAPSAEYGKPASVTVNDGFSVTGWTNTGTVVGSTTLGDRTNNGGTPDTIGSIFYQDSGDVGWCFITPAGTALQTYWMGDRMQIVLNSGGANEEIATVRDVIPAITSTTIEGILYDAGTSGLCSLTLVGSPSGLVRNSLLQIVTQAGDGATETVRVLEVVYSPDGKSYSVRCECQGKHSAGATVNGALCLYAWTNLTHLATETITDPYIYNTCPSGIGGIGKYGNLDLSKADGRPISVADDYMHISVFLADPSLVTNLRIRIDVDAATSSVATAFTRNYYTWTIPQSQLVAAGLSGDVGNTWVDLVIALSAGLRSGTDFTRSLANAKCIQVELEVTGSTVFGFDNWYLFGTYGPLIQPNSPTGYIYASRFRNSQTGVYSVPSPVTRFEMFPLREAVTVTPPVSDRTGVDTIDIYREGGSLTSLLYVGSLNNNFGSPQTFTDTISDLVALEINQSPDLTAFAPWPVQIPPDSGVVNVVGTTVQLVSGDPFHLPMIGSTVIQINGKSFITYGQPRTASFLELTQDAGTQLGVPYTIPNPVLAEQPLPFVFGPLEGPFAPVVFGLGDTNHQGLLYFTNSANADNAGDGNYLELTSPSEGLVSGCVWQGLVLVGSRDNVFCVRYSYLTTIGVTNNSSFQFARVPVPSGIWSRWACCSCPLGMAYLGRDGIYICTENQGLNITNDKLYPLFPHEGQPAHPVQFGSSIVYPVDMNQENYLRLSYCDQTLRFSYIDTQGNYQTLIFDIPKKRWLLNNYANHIGFHYLVEKSVDGGDPDQILMGSLDSNEIVLAGGDKDKLVDIPVVVLVPAVDGGDERSQKLFVDMMSMVDGQAGGGTLTLAPAYDNAQIFGPVSNITLENGVKQYLTNIDNLSDLSLYKNIACKFSWTGGPSGPKLYAWETSGFLQPYVSTSFVTQFINLSFPGWKHMRRAYPALISNGDVLFTVKCQDGRVFGPYTIPTTAGQYRILPQMLDHGIKDLAFAFELKADSKFAFFPGDFVVQVKHWEEETYIDLAVLKA